MKKPVFLVLAVAVVTFIGCFSCNSGGKDLQAVIPNGIKLSVEPGEHWMGKMKVFIFSINNAPQMAAWIENANGDYISTITVTDRSAKKNWRSAPKEGRPEALPVWNHKTQDNAAQVDSVSAATSKGAVDVQMDNGSLMDGQEYNVYLEINHSYDYNDTWTEGNSGVNGQPSLIYHAKFTMGKFGRIELTPIGHGSVDGSDGTIVNGLDGFTTALTMIKDAYIENP